MPIDPLIPNILTPCLGKAAVASQRNERLAHRNPERLQRQIDKLWELESISGKLSNRDKKTLEELERDVARVRKAKEAIGDKSCEHQHGDGRGRDGRTGGREGGILGKRGRGWRKDRESDGSETDEGVRNIPMPRDTPPSIPAQRHQDRDGISQHQSGANLVPLGEGRGVDEREQHNLPEKPPKANVQAQTLYEAEPAIRDLRKEAVGRFVPAAVQRKLDNKRRET